MKSLLHHLFVFAVGCAIGAPEIQAGEVLQYGTDTGRIGKVDETGGNQAKISFAGDHLMVEGPNFWSCKWQHNNVAVDLTAAKVTDYLIIDASGESADDEPVLKIILFSPDWSKRSTYCFDVSRMKKNGFSKTLAMTALGNPSDVEGGGVAPGSPVGHVMFMTAATRGLHPWLLKIKSISVGPAPAP